MAQSTCQSACLMCTMGVGPSTLNVVPPLRVTTSALPAATIMHHKPFVNIMPFPACVSPANPAVVPPFVPVGPCIPTTPSPWVPGSLTVMINNQPALSHTSKLICQFGGVISIVFPGQITTMIP